MNGKLADPKTLVFLIAVLCIALFVGISFVNMYIAGLLLAITVLVIGFGVLIYGVDEKD